MGVDGAEATRVRSVMIWLMLLPALADPSADPRSRRLEREEARCEAALVKAGDRYARICTPVDAAPAVPLRKHRRIVRRLISRRARHTRARERTRALGQPATETTVFFATTREPLDDDFGVREHELSWGIATVTIPAGHPVGTLEHDLAIRSIEHLSPEDFQTRLRQAAGTGELLVHVHGYNNSFAYATRRLAQVQHDLDRPSVPVLFAWPSRGGSFLSMAKYTYDENAAARATPAFTTVLDQILEEQHVPVSVMAHSMGSRVVAESLADLDRVSPDHRPLQQLVLAAPDIDASVFSGRYAELALTAASRLTIYCADDDRALRLSASLHGGYDRLGSCRTDSLAPLITAGADVVDASSLYVDYVDHDKVAGSPRLIGDLRAVLDGVPASERPLESDAAGWVLPP